LLPASDANVEAANDMLLFFCEVTMLNVWSQIVEPSQPAAFPASLQPCNDESYSFTTVTSNYIKLTSSAISSFRKQNN
jgi:hypothetical protein